MNFLILRVILITVLMIGLISSQITEYDYDYTSPDSSEPPREDYDQQTVREPTVKTSILSSAETTTDVTQDVTQTDEKVNSTPTDEMVSSTPTEGWDETSVGYNTTPLETEKTTLPTTTPKAESMDFNPPNYRYKVRKYSSEDYTTPSVFLLIAFIVIILSIALHFYLDTKEKQRLIIAGVRYKPDKKVKALKEVENKDQGNKI